MVQFLSLCLSVALSLFSSSYKVLQKTLAKPGHAQFTHSFIIIIVIISLSHSS